MRCPSLLWIAALPLFVACGDDDHDHDHDDTDVDDTDMGMDDTDMGMDDTDLPEPDTYADGLSKTTDAGHFSVALTLSNGMNTGLTDVTLVVTSQHMQGPVAGATVDLDATMPMMGHGTNDISFTEGPDGTYTATGLDITMGGYWLMTVDVQGMMHADSVEFAFDYPGGM